MREHRHSSSALKFRLIARGEADVYPRFGPTGEMGHGGRPRDPAGGRRFDRNTGRQALGYGKPNFLNGEFVAYGRR